MYFEGTFVAAITMSTTLRVSQQVPTHFLKPDSLAFKNKKHGCYQNVLAKAIL
jgi:hypothetical protein